MVFIRLTCDHIFVHFHGLTLVVHKLCNDTDCFIFYFDKPVKHQQIVAFINSLYYSNYFINLLYLVPSDIYCGGIFITIPLVRVGMEGIRHSLHDKTVPTLNGKCADLGPRVCNTIISNPLSFPYHT